MKSLLTCLLLALSLVISGSLKTNAKEPVQLIFDTDITGDVDDVLALAMIHALADRGECDLLGVTISKINPLTGPFTDAVNTFYGRPDVPIGVTHDAQKRDSKYLGLVTKKKNGKFRYPHDVLSNEDLPNAVTLLRQLLANAKDHSIVIVQVGLAANLADLVESKADSISSLSGKELIQKKVKLVSVMAGAFEPINGKKRFLEANVRNGIDSMQRFARLWPVDVPIIWSGFEIGIAVRYPRESILDEFRYRKHHIVPEAYLLHSGPNHDRPSWDLTSVLYAVRPDAGYFGLSKKGTVRIENDGFMVYKADPNGRDQYLTFDKIQPIRVTEAQRYLVTQPPRTTAAQ